MWIIGVLLVAVGVPTFAYLHYRSGDENGPPTIARNIRIAKGDLATAPVAVWSFDAASFVDAAHDERWPMPQPGGTDAPLLFGLADGPQTQDPVDLQVLAVDPSSGELRWRTDLGEIRQCAEEIDDVVLACYADSRVVYLDVADGAILGEVDTDFSVYHVRAANGIAYVSGRSSDMLTSTISSGTYTDVRAHWSRSYDSPSPGRPVSPMVAPDRTVGAVYASGAILVVDIATGAPRATIPGELLLPVGNDLVLRIERDSDGTTTEALVDGDGRVRTVIPVPTAGQLLHVPVVDTDRELPLFLGDGAYDAITGAEIWRNPSMLEHQASGPIGSVHSVVGDTVVVASAADRTLSGIGLSDGVTRWITPWQDAYWVRDGATDGENFVFGDFTGMHSIRVSDGRILWSVPWPDGTDPRQISVGESAGVLVWNGVGGTTVWGRPGSA